MVNWMLRLSIFIAILPRAVAKVVKFEAFYKKFDLDPDLAAMAAAAEILGVLFIFAGPFLYRFKVWFTTLGAALIFGVQLGAISMVHWPVWFYYKYGMEYNIVILMLCTTLLVAIHKEEFNESHATHIK